MNSDFASTSPESLLRAFANTDYRLRIGAGEYVVHPGCVHQSLDADLGNRRWAIVTAFNPQASRIDDTGNRRRHQQLIEAIRRRGWESRPAVNRDPDGRWPDEQALLIVDADPRDLDALARSLDQAAIVTGRPGAPARLRLYGRRWPETLPDWACRVN